MIKNFAILIALLLTLAAFKQAFAADQTPLFQKPVKLDASGRPIYNPWEQQEIQRRNRNKNKRLKKNKPQPIASQSSPIPVSTQQQQPAPIPVALPAPSAEATSAAANAVDSNRPIPVAQPIKQPYNP